MVETNLLYFHRGDAIPEPRSILCAPLHFDSELLGVLKLAALNRPRRPIVRTLLVR